MMKLFEELIDIDQTLRSNQRYCAAVVLLAPAFASIKQWLLAPHQTVPESVQEHYRNIIAVISLFSLPLMCALEKNHVATVRRLLQAGAVVDDAILQSLINAQQVDSLKLLLEESPSVPDLTTILLNNVLNRRSANNAMHGHIIQTIVLYVSPEIINGIYLPKQFDYHRANTDYPFFGPVFGGTPLMFAARNGLTHVVEALLMRPRIDTLMRTPAGITAFKCARDSGNQALCSMLKKGMVKQLYHTLKFTSAVPYNAEVSQLELAAYILTRAQSLPLYQESNFQIHEEMNNLNNLNNGLHRFLAGYVLHRVRTKLIVDLNNEISRRQGTSTLHGHLMPHSRKNSQEFELISMEPDSDAIERNDLNNGF